MFVLLLLLDPAQGSHCCIILYKVYILFCSLVRFCCETGLNAAAKNKRLICNLNQKVKRDRNSLKAICKHGKQYSVSGTNVFSLWFQISYLFTIFIYSSVKEVVIIIYLNGSFNGSLVCFQRPPRQLRQTSIHTYTNFVTRT